MGDIFGGNQVQMTLFLLAGKAVLQCRRELRMAWWDRCDRHRPVCGWARHATAQEGDGIGPDSLLVVLAYGIGLAGLIRIS
jgi:hypothetical protein